MRERVREDSRLAEQRASRFSRCKGRNRGELAFSQLGWIPGTAASGYPDRGTDTDTDTEREI